MGKSEINWLKKIWEALTDLVSARGGSGGSGGAQVQADWNEADNTKPSYIKNKPQITPGASAMIVDGTYAEEQPMESTEGFVPDAGSPTYEEAVAHYLSGSPVILRWFYDGELDTVTTITCYDPVYSQNRGALTACSMDTNFLWENPESVEVQL